MKILITGSSGMLGNALSDQLSGKHEIIGLDIVKNQKSIECDITDRDKTTKEIVSVKPDVIIHAAAYTDVEGCESNEQKSNQINALGTQTLALIAQSCGAVLYYLSTDFIFDGEKQTAYIEEDKPNPINVYGKSKLAGEKYVQSILKRFVIVRSSWLFGQGGRNFVDTILKKMQNEKKVKVVNDQFGSPTYTRDLARAIGRLLDLGKQANGIYHITNSGSCSWYQLACAVKQLAGLDAEVLSISSEEYPSRTRRPKMCTLNNGRYLQEAGSNLRHWQEALKEYLLK